MGMTEEKFYDSTPYEIEAYLEAYEIRQRETDARDWRMGYYNLDAFQTVLAHAFTKHSGKRYIEKPLLEEEFEKRHMTEEELTEEEKRRFRENFVMKIQIMGANFKLRKQQEQLIKQGKIT